jgi:hypothetical protein
VRDQPRLEEVVRHLLDAPSAEPLHWHAEPRQGGGRVNVLSGAARVGDEQRPWRVVRKELPAPAGVEAAVHRSGLLDDLPSGGVRAPRCYGVDEGPDGTITLWLELVHEEGDPRWSLGDWASAARHLGRFNGAYLAGRPLPEEPWLKSDQMRAWLERHTLLVARIAAAAEDPAVNHWWPRHTVDAILRLWEERTLFCEALERLPRTLCHGDAIRRNLLFQGGGLVAIDWENVGLYAPGEEVGQTLSVAAAFFDWEPSDLPVLDEALFGAYFAGLREAGASPNEREVRFAYCAHAALRNLFNAVGSSVPPEAGAASALRSYGRTWQALAGQRAAIRPFLLARADEARRLMEVL